MKKALFVAFKIETNDNTLNQYKINGTLYHQNKKISEYKVKHVAGKYGNLIFDLPFNLPDGNYKIELKKLSSEKKLGAETSISVDRAELRPYWRVKNSSVKLQFEEITQPIEKLKLIPSELDRKRGYIVFSRSPFEYVYPGAKPQKSEVIDSLSLTVCRNEFEPITFTIFPLRDLGEVTVSITDLVGPNDIISKQNVEIAHVEEVDSTIGLPAGKFQKIPKLLTPNNAVKIKKENCERFWLTIRIDADVLPGEYKGNVIIDPVYGGRVSLPLRVNVTPITLSDIPGVDYFMLMTYEFVELAMPWSKKNKEKIYKAALNVLKDYKEHGMTTLCLHSPFVSIFREDGSQNLDDILYGLKAVKEAGFDRPIIYYIGHLIQTAKDLHPGNIGSFDREIHTDRLKNLIIKISSYSKQNNLPNVIFCPIDEPHDEYSDPSGIRREITPMLLKSIHEMNARTMITSKKYFSDLDYLCSGEFNRYDLSNMHQRENNYWIYDNSVTIKCDDPSYARYRYGYYVWQTGIDGFTSWTFQTTQNARGYPMVLDTGFDDVYLAYPDPHGPISTIKWEAIREGIDDHKLLYQLERRLDALDSNNVDLYQKYLDNLKNNKIDSDISIERDPEEFENLRKILIDLIIEADEAMAYSKWRETIN